MKGHIMRSLLLILVFAFASSQARTLIEDFDKLKGNYGRTPKSPPPAPFSAPPIEETFPLLLEIFNTFGRSPPSPPSPKPSTPIIPLMITSSADDTTFWVLQNYGRKALSPPPAPKLPPPIHQLSGSGVAAAEGKSSENLFRSA